MRIRSIKPEFWSDEKLSLQSPIDRLVFLGLISMADDFGRLHDNIKVIDAFVFPNTDDSVRESVANLSRMNRIRRGKSSNGMAIIEIVNWDKHQKVDKPQPKMALPPIAEKTNENVGESFVLESFANGSRTDREIVAPHSTSTSTSTISLVEQNETDVSEIVTLWNNSQATIKVQKLTEDRRRRVRTRLKESGWKETFLEAIKLLPIQNSGSFTWQPDFDWMTSNQSNVLKIVEGRYRSNQQPQQQAYVPKPKKDFTGAGLK